MSTLYRISVARLGRDLSEASELARWGAGVRALARSPLAAHATARCTFKPAARAPLLTTQPRASALFDILTPNQHHSVLQEVAPCLTVEGLSPAAPSRASSASGSPTALSLRERVLRAAPIDVGERCGFKPPVLVKPDLLYNYPYFFPAL